MGFVVLKCVVSFDQCCCLIRSMIMGMFSAVEFAEQKGLMLCLFGEQIFPSGNFPEEKRDFSGMSVALLKVVKLRARKYRSVSLNSIAAYKPN